MSKAFLVSDKGVIFGTPDYTRLNALPFYKRWYAAISKKYMHKYVDIKPYDITINKEDEKTLF